MIETKVINLTKGLQSIVDSDDYEQLMLFNWHASLAEKRGKYYAYSNIGKTRERKKKNKYAPFYNEIPRGNGY